MAAAALIVSGAVLADLRGETDPGLSDGYRLKLEHPGRYRLNLGGEFRMSVPPSPPAAAAPTPHAHLPYAAEVFRAATAAGIEPALVHAVIRVESGYDPRAVSPKGAQGLMQLMPDTARRYGLLNPFHPERNIHAGSAYLRDLIVLFDRDLVLVLAAYNAGEGAVARYGNRMPPFAETRAYVPRVLRIYGELKPPPPLTAPVRARKQYRLPADSASPASPH